MPGRQAWLWCLSTFALAVLPPHAPATLADEERSRPSAINAVNFSSLTGSPDPRCTVRLPAIRTLWMTDALPIFFDAGQLAASPWRDYVTLVYGEPEFPIDMRCFTFFWKDHLPEAVRSQFESRYKAPDQPARDGDVYNIGSGELAWQIYLLEKADVLRDLQKLRGSSTGYVPVLMGSSSGESAAWQADEARKIIGPFADGTWIEGFHEYDDCASARKNAEIDPGLGDEPQVRAIVPDH